MFESCHSQSNQAQTTMVNKIQHKPCGYMFGSSSRRLKPHTPIFSTVTEPSQTLFPSTRRQCGSFSRFNDEVQIWLVLDETQSLTFSRNVIFRESLAASDCAARARVSRSARLMRAVSAHWISAASALASLRFPHASASAAHDDLRPQAAFQHFQPEQLDHCISALT